MSHRGALAGWAVTLFLTQMPARGAELPAHEELRDLLLQRLDAGHADSARAAARLQRVDVPEVVAALLADRDRDLAHGRADSAAVRLKQAQAIASLYRDAVADTSCVRMTDFREQLTVARRTAVSGGWKSYAEFLAMIPQWGRARSAIPGLVASVTRAEDPYLEATARRYMGRCLLMTASAPEARTEFERSRLLAERLGDRTGERYTRILIARSYLTEDRIDDALRLLDAILEPARKDEDWTAWLWAASTVVTCRLHLGDLDGAKPTVDEGLALARRVGPRKWEAEFLGHSAMLLGLTGHYAESIERREEARRIQKELDLTGPELDSIIQLAWLYSVEERYSRALSLMREGLAIAERTGITEAIAILHVQIGETWLRLGRPEEALRHYESVLPAARAMAIPRQVAMVLRGIGNAHVALGDPAAAVPWFEQAWETIRAHDVPLTVEEILPDLAEAYERTGKLELAERRFEDARVIAEKLGNPYLLGEAERGLGRVLAREGHAERARELVDGSVRRGRTIGVPALLRDALVDAADLRAASGDWAAADTVLAEAISIVESVRAGQAGEDVRVGFLANKKSIYARRVAALTHLDRAEEAFAVSERARARALLDVLGDASAEVSGDVPAPLRERERRLMVQLGDAQAALSEAVSAEAWESALVDSLRGAAEEAGREYRATLDEISEKDPRWAALAGRRAPLDLAQVRSRVLGKDRVLIEYLVSGDRSFVFLAGERSFRAAPLPAGEDSLRALVGALRSEIARGEPAPPSAGTLYAVLIRPVADAIPDGARLLVVPDGPLFHVPFALLRDAKGMLLDHHPVSYAPSASALDPQLWRGGAHARRSLLAVGNPSTFRSEALLSAERDAQDWRFGELPYATEEVRRAARHFRRATVLTGDDATEKAVKSAIGAATHVHFATHGLLNENEPILSGLALAQTSGGDEDGVLQVHEILALPLDAELVILSACNTALGRVTEGEGVVGLSRAFLHAGARSLVLSLWEVADRTTADLMDRFYVGHLDHALPRDVALQRAQAAAIAAGRLPREWAPFVLVGDVESRRQRVPPSIPLVAAVAGALVLLALVREMRRRRRS